MIHYVDCVSTAELEALPGDPCCAVISITSPDRRPTRIAHGFSGVLRLAYYDAVLCEFDHGWRSHVFDTHMARETLLFLVKINRIPAVRGLLCECHDGLTQCAPIAEFAASLYGAHLHLRRPTDSRNSPIFRRLSHIAGTTGTVHDRRFDAPLLLP